jgi:hypothetical protein
MEEEIEVEEIEVELVEDVVVEEAAVEIPAAEKVFDAECAVLWMRKAYARRTSVYGSLRFEPEGMPESQLNFLFYLAGRSLKVGGRLYAPVFLVDRPALTRFKRGERVGDYVEFIRE